MAWTPRTTAAAVVLVTGLVNLAIVYVAVGLLFGGHRLLLGAGAVLIAVGSVGGYLSLSRSLAERAAERDG